MGQQINSWSADADGAALSGELHRALGVSHRQAKGLIDAGCVTINGKSATAHGMRLKQGDNITVNFDSDVTYSEIPHRGKGDDSAVNILWEDKHLVFLDKPAGLLSVPTEHSDDASLADALVEHYRQKGIKKPRIYIVHRLDRYTTGAIVFAKTPEALNGLRELFHEHQINRVYRAILVGELPENTGTLYDKLVERTRWMKMVVAARRSGSAKPEGAKPAVTHYRVIERLPGHTVVELTLETGRRNQIRVQFSERGYPILGDHIYGAASPILSRQALHAELLGLCHPVTEENITIQSRLPDDMEMALRRLRAIRRVGRAKAGLKGEDGIFQPRITKERKQERITRAKRFSKDGAASRPSDRAVGAARKPRQTDGREDGQAYSKTRAPRPAPGSSGGPRQKSDFADGPPNSHRPRYKKDESPRPSDRAGGAARKPKRADGEDRPAYSKARPPRAAPGGSGRPRQKSDLADGPHSSSGPSRPRYKERDSAPARARRSPGAPAADRKKPSRFRDQPAPEAAAPARKSSRTASGKPRHDEKKGSGIKRPRAAPKRKP